MRDVTLSRTAHSHTRGDPVSDRDLPSLSSPVRILCDGEPVAVLVSAGLSTAPLAHALERVKIALGARTRGARTRSRPFGSVPRSPIRGDYCHVAQLAHELPVEHDLICRVAAPLDRSMPRVPPPSMIVMLR